MRLSCRWCDWRSRSDTDAAWEELDRHLLLAHRYDGERFVPLDGKAS